MDGSGFYLRYRFHFCVSSCDYTGRPLISDRSHFGCKVNLCDSSEQTYKETAEPDVESRAKETR